jgi:hypothetical protein
MVYKFDPTYWNGTTFHLDEDAWEMVRGWTKFERDNQPIPGSYFPNSLVFDGASAALPDMFHTDRGIIVFSERARVVMENWAPGQVEFIPVAVQATPEIADQLNFATAYYFVNVLGRSQRLRWLEMPTREFPRRDDGTEIFGLLHDFSEWKLRERAAGEPWIWHDTAWRSGNKDYSGHGIIFVEDVLWRELDANFPDQLNALRVGE